MKQLSWSLCGALLLLVVAGVFGVIFLNTAKGFSAREEPSRIEEWVAREARSMAIPAEAKGKTNPIANSAEVLAEARAHWADHCASCHANNGSGETEMGKHLYPPSP